MSASTPLFADYHIHTPYCGHAQGATIDYVEAAIRAGLSEIGFSDHLGRYYLTKSQRKRYWDWGMRDALLPRYLAEINDLKAAYKDRILIRTGLEVDFIEGAEDLLNEALDGHELDYILGSIHCIPAVGWKHIATYTQQPPYDIYVRYFDQAENAIASGLFDVLAHLDFIWRYIKWPEEKTDEIFDRIRRVVALAARSEVAVEINANGYLWSQMRTQPAGDPFRILVEAIRDSSAIITVGSDAHKPFMVAKAFPEIGAMLRDFGLTRQCIFDKKIRGFAPFA